METFKAIEGFAGYEISDLGRVRSNKRQQPRIMALQKSQVGERYYINLRTESTYRAQSIANLVANAFVPNPHGYDTIKFKDGDKANLKVQNLEWVEHLLCSECSARSVARGMCIDHYQIWYKKNYYKIATPKWIKDVVGYTAAHARVRALRGPVTNYKCDCGAQAKDYALQITAEDVYREIKGRNAGSIYSLNADDYKAMCKKCHIEYDRLNSNAYNERFADCIEYAMPASTQRSELDFQAITQRLIGGERLKDIATDLSVDQSHISRIALLTLGMTLRDYRKLHQQDVA